MTHGFQFVHQTDAPNAPCAYWGSAVMEWALAVSSSGLAGRTDGRSSRLTASCFLRHRPSLSDVWIPSADKLEQIGFTALGALGMESQRREQSF